MTISFQDMALLHEISSPASLSLRPQHLHSRLHGKVLHKKSIRVLRSHILGDLWNRIIRQLLKLLILTLQHKRHLRIHQTLGLHEICPLAQTEKWQIHFSNSAAEWRYLSFLSAWRTAYSLPVKQKKRKNLVRVSRHKSQNAVCYRAWNKMPKKKKVPPTFTELEFTSILLLHHWR